MSARAIELLLRLPTILAAPVVALMVNVPALRRTFWGAWYEWLSGVERPETLAFLNYGYAAQDSGAESVRIAALAAELPRTDAVQAGMARLYEHLIEMSPVPLAGARTLEVGCGRGGGSFLIAKRYAPAEHLGVDLSPAAVAHCQARYHLANLAFEVGDATALPVGDASRDVVINVESSHCYADTRRFLREVHRVLSPGGHLLLADFRPPKHAPVFWRKIEEAGFEVLVNEDITGNVVGSLDRTGEGRARLLDAGGLFERGGPPLLRNFAGVPGTLVHDLFVRRRLVYFAIAAKKRGELGRP